MWSSIFDSIGQAAERTRVLAFEYFLLGLDGELFFFEYCAYGRVREAGGLGDFGVRIGWVCQHTDSALVKLWAMFKRVFAGASCEEPRFLRHATIKAMIRLLCGVADG